MHQGAKRVHKRQRSRENLARGACENYMQRDRETKSIRLLKPHPLEPERAICSCFSSISRANVAALSIDDSLGAAIRQKLDWE